MMKKLLCMLLIVSVMCLSPLSVCGGEVSLSAEAYVLYCTDNGKVLLSGAPDKELPIASTTKIMTALLTLEAAAADDRIVEFTDEMTAEGSSMYLRKGEKVKLYDLAVGMMMQSGNDAANAAAIAIAGSIAGFAELMNDRAHKLGMEHTRFVTPSGLDDPEHYSTARDMALLMAEALKNEDFAYITSQTSMEVHFVYPADKFITYPNHNKLLRIYDGCIGGKTGYTDEAGRTLVSAARKDGMTLIAVTLNDRDDWDDHAAMYDYGFGAYTKFTPDINVGSVSVVGGYFDELSLSADMESVVIPKGDNDIRTQVYLPPFLYAPIEEGYRVGKAVCTLGGETIAEIPLTAACTVEYNDDKRSFTEYIKDKSNWLS